MAKGRVHLAHEVPDTPILTRCGMWRSTADRTRDIDRVTCGCCRRGWEVDRGIKHPRKAQQ